VDFLLLDLKCFDAFRLDKGTIRRHSDRAARKTKMAEKNKRLTEG
jgi:hypothetical protein